MTTVSLSPESLREKAEARKEPAWLIEARLTALALAERIEPPAYRRTDMRGLDIPALALRAYAAPNARDRRHAPRPPEGLVQMPLSQAAYEHEDLVRPLLTQAPDPAATKWDALRAALWTQGEFLHVEKDTDLPDAIQIRSVLPEGGGLVRDVLTLGRSSRVSLVDRWTGGATQGQTLGLTSVEAHVGENAHLQLSLLQETGHATTLLQQRRAFVRRDGRITWIDGQFGGGKSVTTNEILLTEQGAKVHFVGAFFGSGKQHFDITTSALHRAPNTESQLDMKGALNDDGYAANYSIVFIGHDAPSSAGHQHQETLILSPGARADAIPKLDVENNDVSASHGATVGQVDPEQIFYLRSRGMDQLQAMRTIVEGFFEPLLREIPFEDVRDDIGRALVSRVK